MPRPQPPPSPRPRPRPGPVNPGPPPGNPTPLGSPHPPPGNPAPPVEYQCVFHFAGCESMMTSKNEWKRHIMSQHVPRYHWVCEIDNCGHSTKKSEPSLSPLQKGGTPHSPSVNPLGSPLPDGEVFDRKELHTQHLRRTHVPPHIVKRWETNPPTEAEWNDHITIPQFEALRARFQMPDCMECPVPHCNSSYFGSNSWDEWMEHVGRHCEKARAGEESPVVFDGSANPSLLAWATKPDVAIITSAGPGAWTLNYPPRPVQKLREIREETTDVQPDSGDSFSGEVWTEQPFQAHDTIPEPQYKPTPTERTDEVQGEFVAGGKIHHHQVGFGTNASHDDDLDIPIQDLLSPVPPLEQPLEQFEGSSSHRYGESDSLHEDSPHLAPRQIGATGTAQTDSGYGTSVAPRSINPRLRNQDSQKDAWYQPLADTAKTVQTDYSDIQLPRPRFNKYSSELAGCLLEDLKECLRNENIRDVLQSLPDLFKAFALRLAQSQSPSSQRQLEVVYFVYRFRDAICTMVEEHWNKKWYSESPPETPTANDGIPPSEKCETWLEQAGFSSDFEPLDEPDSAWVGVSDDEVNDMSVEDLAEYHELVCSSPAYSWLLECIRRNASLGLRGAATVSPLADQIFNALPTPSRISRTSPILPLSVKFTVAWNPIEYLRHQGHEGKASHIISKIITLTGQVVDAQATTTEEYLHQTWPATGGHFLGAIETALRAKEDSDNNARGTVITYVYPDETRITTHFGDQGLELDVTGSAYSIAEVGDQLGWLMSALQSSSSTSMGSSRPILRSLVQTPMAGRDISVIAGRYVCILDVVIEPLQPTEQQQDGQCWHKLFNNPVIVADYPVLPRSCLEPSKGLEVPFDILIALAETPVLTSFGQSYLMKGYSTMLVPVLDIGNIIVWHFIFNEIGDRVSFLDSRLSNLDSVNPIEVDNHQTRHIVGWCSKARSMTGSPDANYQIEKSGLHSPKVHHTLKSLSITASRVPVGAGLNFEISKKDKLVVSEFPKGYANLIIFLREVHVVLYDVATRCGWLVDGQSAVLHLVRASLEKDLRDFAKSPGHFRYQSDQLHNAADTLDGPEAASAVLLDERNLLLELMVHNTSYHTEWTESMTSPSSSAPKKEKKYKETYSFFKDRVMEICTSLEKIVDHMNNRNTEDGINFVLRAPQRRFLGGFDFMDIASNKGSFSVREMPLRSFSMEEGWTALTSSLGAITLFGKGFGDLIRPVMLKDMHACNACGFGAAIPRDKDYLMARSSLVKSFFEEKGDSTAHPWQIVDGLYWQAPHATFQPCDCVKTADRQRQVLKLQDRIQVLYRWKLPASLNRASCLSSVPTHGAMIFGHSFLPNIRVERGNEGSSFEIFETEVQGETSQDTMSNSIMLTSSSGGGGHTQSTSRTSAPPSSQSTSDGIVSASDSGQVGSKGKGKRFWQRTARFLTVPDRSSREGPYEATSGDDSTAATGSDKKRRFMEKLRLG